MHFRLRINRETKILLYEHHVVIAFYCLLETFSRKTRQQNNFLRLRTTVIIITVIVITGCILVSICIRRMNTTERIEC